MGDAGEIVVSKLSPVHGFVSDAVGIDCCAAFIGEQGELDVFRVRVALERFDRIVANCDEDDAGFLELVQVFLQLDQLLLTVGSPIG